MSSAEKRDYREIIVKIKLRGWFPRIYNHNKSENSTDDAYVNAMVSDWLLDRDEKNPVNKPALNGDYS